MMQLKCCGVHSLSDYSNITWTPRKENVLAPLTCCKGLRSKDNKNEFPPIAFDSLKCIIDGTSVDYYQKQVRFVVFFIL